MPIENHPRFINPNSIYSSMGFSLSMVSSDTATGTSPRSVCRKYAYGLKDNIGFGKIFELPYLEFDPFTLKEETIWYKNKGRIFTDIKTTLAQPDGKVASRIVMAPELELDDAIPPLQDELLWPYYLSIAKSCRFVVSKKGFGWQTTDTPSFFVLEFKTNTVTVHPGIEEEDYSYNESKQMIEFCTDIGSAFTPSGPLIYSIGAGFNSLYPKNAFLSVYHKEMYDKYNPCDMRGEVRPFIRMRYADSLLNTGRYV